MEQLINNISYDQVWALVKQLPYRDKKKLNSQIEQTLAKKRNRQAEENTDAKVTDLQQFLLQGPTMSDIQFAQFKKLREDFSQWQEK